MKNRVPLILAAVAVAIVASRPCQADTNPVTKCQAAKLLAWGDYRLCLATVRQKALLGRQVDPAQCDARLASDLAEADQIAPCRFLGSRQTILDLQTGLMWERKSSSDGIADFSDPNDIDNRYDWFQANSDFISRMNGLSGDDLTLSNPFAGFSDWRLPTIVELNAIFTGPCPNQPSACFPPELGPTAPDIDFYWTVTTYLPDDTFAMYNNVHIDFNKKAVAYHARAVRNAL
jgi:uncharacterized protein DUF1566